MRSNKAYKVVISILAIIIILAMILSMFRF